jgi:hypothetical protein
MDGTVLGSRINGSDLDYEKGFELCKAAVRHLLDISESIPVVGSFATAIMKLIDISDRMKLDKDNARLFKVTLFDASRIVDNGAKLIAKGDKAINMEAVSTIVSELEAYITCAASELEKYTRKNIIGRFLTSTFAINERPSYLFIAYDATITKKLTEFSTALSMTQFVLSQQTYRSVENIEKWCETNGGIATISQDVSKTRELATVIGNTADRLTWLTVVDSFRPVMSSMH